MSRSTINSPLKLLLGQPAALDAEAGLVGQFARQCLNDELPLDISSEALPHSVDELRKRLQETGAGAMIAVALHGQLHTTPRILVRVAEVARLPRPSWLLVPAYQPGGDCSSEPSYSQFDRASFSGAMPAGCLASCFAAHLLICRGELLGQWLDASGSTTLSIESCLQDLLCFLLEHVKGDGFLLCGEGSFDPAPAAEPAWAGETLALRELSWLGPIGRHALPFLLRSMDESP